MGTRRLLPAARSSYGSGEAGPLVAARRIGYKQSPVGPGVSPTRVCRWTGLETVQHAEQRILGGLIRSLLVAQRPDELSGGFHERCNAGWVPGRARRPCGSDARAQRSAGAFEEARVAGYLPGDDGVESLPSGGLRPSFGKRALTHFRGDHGVAADPRIECRATEVVVGGRGQLAARTCAGAGKPRCIAGGDEVQ